ncbi:MAG: hypothetical protein AAF821_24380 [Cyanobacteria bacterium P01_D01_bin.156]
MSNSLWDMAGVDSLAVAKDLFGQEVGYLAPFQSIETMFEGKNCSILRLCERNFRIAYSAPLHPLIDPLHANIWFKQFDWLARIVLPSRFLPTIVSQATVRPPHRLRNIPNHQAAPAQFNDIPVLLWQHPNQGKASLELHCAQKDLEILQKIVTTEMTEVVQ